MIGNYHVIRIALSSVDEGPVTYMAVFESETAPINYVVVIDLQIALRPQLVEKRAKQSYGSEMFYDKGLV